MTEARHGKRERGSEGGHECEYVYVCVFVCVCMSQGCRTLKYIC